MELAELETIVKDNPDAVAAIKAASEKLGKIPELETKLGEASKLVHDVANLKAINDDLLKQKEEWKKGATGTQAEYNALIERQKATETKLDEVSGKLTAAEEEKAKAISESREANLKTSVTTAATAVNALRPEEEFIILKAKGLVGHDDKGKEFFHKLNEKGEPVKVSSAKELLEWWIGSDKTKQAAGGKPGVGGDHRGGGDLGPQTPASRNEARAALRNIFMPK